MRKLILAVVALSGTAALGATGAVAQPYQDRHHEEAARPTIHNVDYYHNHHQYHHRHYEHGHWRYWD